MRKSFGLFLLILLTVTQFYCSDRSVEPNIVHQGTFPGTVGTQWVYARYDSIQAVEDTITITITDVFTPDSGGTTHVARYEAGDTLRYDTLYIRNDSATWLSGNGYNSWIIERYVFPMEIGKKWTVGWENDSMTVDSKLAVTVPAGQFVDSYRLQRIVYLLNYFNGDQVWVAPGYGVVRKWVRRRYFFDMTDPGQNDVWTLIDYTIPK